MQDKRGTLQVCVCGRGVMQDKKGTFQVCVGR